MFKYCYYSQSGKLRKAFELNLSQFFVKLVNSSNDLLIMVDQITHQWIPNSKSERCSALTIPALLAEYSAEQKVEWPVKRYALKLMWRHPYEVVRHLKTISLAYWWSRKINPLGPSDAIWRQRSGSTLAQVMACCLTVPSHYLNQCRLIISKVEWHSSKGKFTRDTPAINHWNYLQNLVPKISFKFPRDQCVIRLGKLLIICWPLQ